MELEELRKKYLSAKAEQESRGKKVRPQDGKNVYRLLPPKKGKKFPYAVAGIHYNLGDDKNTTEFCILRTKGDPCPICEFVGELYEEKDKASRELAKDIKAKSKYYFPVIVRGREEAGPKILEVGEKAWIQIMGILIDISEETGVFITDPKKGRDIIIDRQGKGFNTEYFVRAGASPSLLSKSKKNRIKWVKNADDVDEYVEEGLLSYKELYAVLEQNEEEEEGEEEEELEEEETEEEEEEGEKEEETEEEEEEGEEEEETEEEEEEGEEEEETEEEEEEGEEEEETEEEEELAEEDFEEDEKTGKVTKKPRKKAPKKKEKKKARKRSGAVSISEELKKKIKTQGGKKTAIKKSKRKTKK